MVIAAGPGGELRARVRAAVRLLRRASARETRPRARSTRSRRAIPAAGRAASPGDQIVAVDGKRGDADDAVARRSPRTSAPQSPPKRLQGERRPRRSWSERDGEAQTLSSRPVYDPQARSARGSASPTQPGPRETLPARRGVDDVTSTASGSSPRQTLELPASSSTPRSARRSRASSAPTRPPARRSSNDVARRVAILALISLSLAIVNLFPFLPLDGGHIFWAVVEKIAAQAGPATP